MPDANLIIGVTYDDKGRQALIASNERAFKQSSQRIAANEQQARRGSAFSGGQNAAYRTGMISQQAQDVAVSLQMGMSASRVIAQQGSQIASIFGPYGMVLGGIVAITAAIWEFSTGTEAAAKAAKELEDHHKSIRKIWVGSQQIAYSTQASRATRERGKYAGENVKLNADYFLQMGEIREEMAAVNKEKADIINKEGLAGLDYSDVENNNERQARLKVISEAAEEKTAYLKQRMDVVRESFTEKATESAFGRNDESFASITALKQASMMSRARAQEATEKDKEASEDLQREIDFTNDRNKIRDSDHSADQKNKQYAALADARADKNDEVAAERKRKRDEDAAAVYLKSAEEQVKMTADKAKAEKDTAQFRDTSVQKYIRTQSELAALEKDYGMGGLERETKISEKKLELRKQEEGAIREIEAMQREGAEFAKAGLSGSDAQNKRKVIEMEMDLLRQKKAFSPIEAQQIANKLELLRREQVNENFNMGGMGAGGMGAFNRNRKAEERAQDRAEQRALGNMGLIDIVRGAGNSVVSGVDPVTGRRLSGKELEARKADMAAEKARRDMERKAAAGDKEAQERLKRVRWGNEQNGNDGKIAAGFSADQIKFLSTSIADAVKELITK